MIANKVLNDFRMFLVASWQSFKVFNLSPSIFNISEATLLEERTNDWLQSNWEILVEQSLCGINEFLEFYGDGADCNGTSSRVWLPDSKPTHRVVCKLKSGIVCMDIFSSREITQQELIKMKFLKFTTLDDNKQWFDDEPPFDCVLLSQNDNSADVLVNINQINFDIEKIDQTP